MADLETFEVVLPDDKIGQIYLFSGEAILVERGDKLLGYRLPDGDTRIVDFGEHG